MPVSCVAYGCSNRFEPGKPINFFRFPIKNQELLKMWVNAVRRKNFKPTQWSPICSAHFTENDYQIQPGADRPLLKVTAVPSVFSSFPSYYQKKEKKERKPPKQRTKIFTTLLDELEPSEPNMVFESDGLPITPKCIDKKVQTSNTYVNEIVLKKKIRSLCQKLRRKEKKINSMEDLITNF